jgi:hypothetical protein
MATVRINTSDTAWIERLGADVPAVAYGTDIKGVMHFQVDIEIAEVEHVKFAGAALVRFDLGPDAPRDHTRRVMYPESYLVSD